MDSIKDLFAKIDALQIEGTKRGPRHIKFYIQFYGEMAQKFTKGIKNANEEIIFFDDVYRKHINEEDTRRNALQIINDAKAAIPVFKKQLDEAESAIRNFCVIDRGYIEDAKRGLWYDQDTSDLLNTSPLKEPPENAYIPGGSIQ